MRCESQEHMCGEKRLIPTYQAVPSAFHYQDLKNQLMGDLFW